MAKGTPGRKRDGVAPDGAAHPDELGKIRVLGTRKWYLSLSAAIGVITATVTTTYALTHFLETKPVQGQLATTSQARITAETDRQTLRNQVDQLQQRYERVVAANERPVLLFPDDMTSIIGAAHNFAWDYGKHDANASYFIELQQLDSQGVRRFNVVRPESKREYVSFDGPDARQYLWRVRPGRIGGGAEIASGPWSLPSTFWVYPSVVDRIKTTGKLIVATTSTSYDSFVAADGAGRSDGYEIALLHSLLPALSQKLGLGSPLKVELVQLPWSRLFTALQRGEADVALRSISKSVFREREYPNLRFTIGYIENHQILVQPRRGGEFPRSLENAKVGVKSNSINEKAAKYLAEKYKFVVDASFVAYSDLYQALADGRIAFAMVDSLLVKRYLGKQLYALGGTLDKELQSFYLKEFERDKEEYAILVHESSQDPRLRTYLNEALASSTIQKANAELRQKFQLD